MIAKSNSNFCIGCEMYPLHPRQNIYKMQIENFIKEYQIVEIKALMLRISWINWRYLKKNLKIIE